MKTAQEFRQHADECRSMARNTRNREHGNQLLKMAEAWDLLAAESERLTQKGPETASRGGRG